MKDIPEDRYRCKYCSWCGIYDENYEGGCTCYRDIGEHVDTTTDACCDFDYDTDFPRT